MAHPDFTLPPDGSPAPRRKRRDDREEEGAPPPFRPMMEEQPAAPEPASAPPLPGWARYKLPTRPPRHIGEIWQ